MFLEKMNSFELNQIKNYPVIIDSLFHLFENQNYFIYLSI